MSKKKKKVKELREEIKKALEKAKGNKMEFVVQADRLRNLEIR